MPNSLTRTTVALLFAAVAVLLTAGVAMRDFIRDMSGPRSTAIYETLPRKAPGTLDPVPMEVVASRLAQSFPLPPRTGFRVVYEESFLQYPGFDNVRIEQLVEEGGETYVCGTFLLTLQPGETPAGLSLFHSREHDEYTVRSDGRYRATFDIRPAGRVPLGRLVSRGHLSLAVSFAAFLALGVAWLRQRKARAYALVMHTWRQAELTSGQMIQSETGEMLGALQSTSRRIWQRAGKVLVAPEVLSGHGLYRDVPVIEPRFVARGSHEEWARATMIRLRDARALAVLSTLTSALALAAHLLA